VSELTLEALRNELAPVKAQLNELAPVRAQLDELRQEMAGIRPRIDGVPLIGAAIETLRHDVRTLRAAINDMARVNITAGEVEALHADVDKTQSALLELETRVATVERLIAEQRR
jgi:prefoldin subunit 5